MTYDPNPLSGPKPYPTQAERTRANLQAAYDALMDADMVNRDNWTGSAITIARDAISHAITLTRRDIE